MGNLEFLRTSRILIVLTGLTVLLSTPVRAIQAAAPDTPLAPGVIDDFKDTQTTPWEFITDKVMGGKSTGKMEFVTHEDRPSLHLTGSVSSKKKNNFIQARRPVDPKKKYFNASDYDGLFFGARREDTQLTSTLQLEFRDVLTPGLTIAPRIRYIDNDSGVALYDYDRTEVGLLIRWMP